jgi:glutamyl-tRNA synthetase
MSREEIIANFSVERVSKTAAVFNKDKLEWMNGVYIRNLSIDDFTERCLPFVERRLPPEVKRPIDAGYLKQIAPLVQERAKTLNEVPQLVDFLFVNKLEYDTIILQGKLDKVQAVVVLEKSISMLEKLEGWDSDIMEKAIRPLSDELSMKVGPFFSVLRVAITGRTASPPLFQTMAVLGRARCMERLKAALQKIKS